MDKADKDILTTAATATLLGVSVRTAQLLIEDGTVPSWKTPGGHRRVYRSDIEALIRGHPAEAPEPSAVVVVVAPADRLAHYERLFAPVAEARADILVDVHAALLAIGAARPHAVLVDVSDDDAERSALIRSLAASAAAGPSRLLVVADDRGKGVLRGRMARLATPEQAVENVRASLADTGGDPKDVETPHAEPPFPLARNERQRLVALERTGLLDTPPEEAFDRLTWLAAQTLETPVALMTLLAPERQWFKSRFGLDRAEVPRHWAFCNHTILQKGVFTVEDLAADPRFADNPAVKGDPAFRFYAGAPVTDGDGFVVGSLCVLDHQPRTLGERETQTLLALAGLASDEVRLRLIDRQLRAARRSGAPAGASRQTVRRGSRTRTSG